MIKVLDFVFNIWYVPFQGAQKGAKFAAVLFLSPSLTFALLGILILLSNLIFGISVVSYFTSFGGSMMAMSTFAIMYFVLDWIYIRNNRDAGSVRYPILYKLLLPVLLLGPLLFFVFAIDKFG